MEQTWATGDAAAIADGTYPWDQFGFSFDDENTPEGPDCLAMDWDWHLITPRGEPTLDLRATRELWFDEDALDDEPAKLRRKSVEILVTVVGGPERSLLSTLMGKRTNLGWNLEAKSERAGAQLRVKHTTFSGQALLTEPNIGVLLCRLIPTDKYDPERLLSVLIGALHREMSR